MEGILRSKSCAHCKSDLSNKLVIARMLHNPQFSHFQLSGMKNPPNTRLPAKNGPLNGLVRLA